MGPHLSDLFILDATQGVAPLQDGGAISGGDLALAAPRPRLISSFLVTAGPHTPARRSLVAPTLERFLSLEAAPGNSSGSWAEHARPMGSAVVARVSFTFDADNTGHCQGWADSGECSRNPGMMRKRCQLSCCRKEGPLSTDKDTSGNCKAWADSGECQKNPRNMAENCAKSCDQCAKVPVVPGWPAPG
mmetsp:Transcript_45547/g.105198  ORF Transcript_45547/g.105198 Transcript_45547/m.105198 type:complete len:189 (+) Transcript_45547:106-672(+)|eukprot:CAMPEP_0171151714 /NCGR_PEP_ID=MMETSP0766_2-20121228/150206_1 /TAXON_ID=439317 /ORGANISM="Gambierdiscus australes, Strain CAWD 149" /LENGTH=188 /DNA_ID=CAMNT_0011615627 /DNA_START=106 /DNA_END=672 /DNA_ORIENTATION=+